MASVLRSAIHTRASRAIDAIESEWKLCRQRSPRTWPRPRERLARRPQCWSCSSSSAAQPGRWTSTYAPQVRCCGDTLRHALVCHLMRSGRRTDRAGVPARTRHARAGGVGSTHLSNFLTRRGLQTNLLLDTDGLRHTPTCRAARRQSSSPAWAHQEGGARIKHALQAACTLLVAVRVAGRLRGRCRAAPPPRTPASHAAWCTSTATPTTWWPATTAAGTPTTRCGGGAAACLQLGSTEREGSAGWRSDSSFAVRAHKSRRSRRTPSLRSWGPRLPSRPPWRSISRAARTCLG